MKFSILLALFFSLALSGCGVTPPKADRHIQADVARAPSIPEPVRSVPLPPPPKAEARPEKYSVVVNNVPVDQLLFALARDAKVNVDIHNGIEGNVTLNAIDQTLPQILTRIARQVDMRFEVEGNNLVVMPDAPFLKNYVVDYANISRNANSTVGIATRVATTGGGASTAGSQSGGNAGGGNNSTTAVSNVSNNRFWETLIQNLKDMLRETDKVFPEGSTETQTSQSGQQKRAATVTTSTSEKTAKNKTATTKTPAGEIETAQEAATVERRFTFREAASVIANPESGLISVRATGRQHEKIQEFLDQVMGAAKRQVLIEATIVEVLLNDNYQGGVDWSRIAQNSGITLNQSVTGGNLSAAPVFVLGYANPTSRLGNISGAVKLLSSFGDTRVLSSPKIMALNNQTSILKVVDEKVYFTTEQKITEGTANNPPRTEFTSTIHTVPVGVVMSVTPQISEGNVVSLNIRPTISRITGFAIDPTPRLAKATFDNLIPEIQTRELESLLRVDSGQIVVMGGLMQDSVTRKRDGLPVVKDVPIVGDAFSYRNDTAGKTELVIFLRPVVIKDGNLDGDFKNYRDLLPNDKFFSGENRPATGGKP